MRLPRTVKDLARHVLPRRLYDSLRAQEGRRFSNRWLEENGVFELALKVAETFHYEVQDGPFKGMKYTRSAVLSRHATPTLLGQYERQIYPALLAAASRADVVIDIGHAEGYYAVGLARMGKRVIAFDADPSEQRVCREMAEINGVADKISLRAWCSAEELEQLVRSSHAMILSDIDGGEVPLLTEDVIAGLKDCDLIIELHGESKEENEPFIRRFSGTHDVEVLGHPGSPGAVASLSFLGDDAERMATEYRPFQQWIIARPKSGSMEADLREDALSSKIT